MKSIAATIMVVVTTVFSLVNINADDHNVFELEPEYVFGKNRGPKIGYTPPPTFDPLNDPLFRAGYKNFTPRSVLPDFKKMEALKRVESLGRITACADGWFWPFSRTVRDHEPDGIEIEILETIASKHDWEVDILWVNMSTRFGPGAPGGAYSQTLHKDRCDLVLGLTISGDDHHMGGEHDLVFSTPYMSTGFVLVTQGEAKKAFNLKDLKKYNIKVGVPAYSPMSEYTKNNGIPYTTFFQNYQVIDAMLKKEINAAMIWSGAISQAKLNRPEAEFSLVEGYVPVNEMRWDSAWVIKGKNSNFKKFIDDSFQEMLMNGEIKRIVERYGMPFYPPK